MNKISLYFEKLPDQIVKCLLCPNYCVLKNHQYGRCMGRKNDGGEMIVTNYAEAVALHLDPIEKKPLYHYFPGSEILSLASNSCNLKCSFCQNYTISQNVSATTQLTPHQLLDICIKYGYKSVAFTYTEPLTWFEYILDCGKIFSLDNIRIVLVTNGYINPGPLSQIIPYIDAMNIDLKSMNNSFYRHICKGKLNPVLDTIRYASSKCHIEVTNLIIPSLNDSDQDFQKLIDFIAGVNSAIPLHLSRYFPQWQCNHPVTPVKTLDKAYELASQKLDYVYIGNIESKEHTDTFCPQCGALLIERNHGLVCINNIKNSCCYHCGKNIYGIFK